MNENLKKAIILYAKNKEKELNEFIDSLSKASIKALFIDILTLYLNDKNSSKLRELITAWIGKYETTEEKLGYNGYKQGIDEKIWAEIKPKNTDNPKKKLDGGGNFSDYTPERFQKDIEKNPQIVVSGFAKGILLYVIEFPFRCIEDVLRIQLEKKFPELKRKKNDYLRSANFTFKDYENCKEVKIIYLSEKIDEFKNYLNKNFYEFLRQKNKNG
jgi:hypothetical protein